MSLLEDSHSMETTEIVTLKALTLNDGAEFFETAIRLKCRGYQSFSSATKSICKKLVDEVGGLPLALDQVALSLRESDGIGCPSEYLEDYVTNLQGSEDEKKLKLLNTTAFEVTQWVSKKCLSVETTWNDNIATITNHSEAAMLSYILSLLSHWPDKIPTCILNEGSPPVEEHLAEALTDQLRRGAILALMTKFSLFSVLNEWNKHYITVHCLVQLCLRRGLADPEQCDIARGNAQKLIEKALEDVNGDRELRELIQKNKNEVERIKSRNDIANRHNGVPRKPAKSNCIEQNVQQGRGMKCDLYLPIIVCLTLFVFVVKILSLLQI